MPGRGWRKYATWEHGTLYGYRSGKCRCDVCAEAFHAHQRAYNQQYRVLRGLASGKPVRTTDAEAPVEVSEKRPRTMDVDVATPMQSCNCSLRGWDPPWQWSWDRAFSFTPFSDMRPWPTALDFVEPLGENGKPIRRWPIRRWRPYP